MMSSQLLPEAFYKGRANARRALVIVLVLLVSSSGVLTVSGRLDVYTLLGPHVQRSEWAFTMTGIRDLNAQGLTGKGVTVCIVDSGLDLLHPDFGHVHILAWKDLVNFRAQPYDDSGHGTAMAGLIVADGSIQGAAPDVQLIVVKALNSAGSGGSVNVAEGIRFCVNPFGPGRMGADIISLSLGSNANIFFDVNVYDAITWATQQGVFVVAAAGNDGLLDDGDVSGPAQSPLAIAVGAVDSQELRAPFTSLGATLNRTDPNLKPEVVAPGVRLISTAPGAHYVTISGSSPAAALTAGLIALILEARPEFHPAGTSSNIFRVKLAIVLGSRKVPGQQLPHDPWYGYGLIYAPGLLAML